MLSSENSKNHHEIIVAASLSIRGIIFYYSSTWIKILYEKSFDPSDTKNLIAFFDKFHVTKIEFNPSVDNPKTYSMNEDINIRSKLKLALSVSLVHRELMENT